MKTKEILYSGKWFDVVNKTFDKAEMSGIETKKENVVVMPYKLYNGLLNEIGVNWECNPSAITGIIEDDESNIEAAKRELFEESGLNIEDNDKWTFLGDLTTSKCVTTVHPCYAVDASEAQIQKASKDGTENERLSEFKFLHISEVVKVEDCFLLSCILKFFVIKYKKLFEVK